MFSLEHSPQHALHCASSHCDRLTDVSVDLLCMPSHLDWALEPTYAMFLLEMLAVSPPWAWAGYGPGAVN